MNPDSIITQVKKTTKTSYPNLSTERRKTLSFHFFAVVYKPQKRLFFLLRQNEIKKP